MNRFPLCVDLEKNRFLVVGGGKIAGRKLSAIRNFTDNIKVVAEEVMTDDFRDIAVEKRKFQKTDLDWVDFVITATGSREMDSEIVSLCKERRIPVNAAGDREECDFFIPSIIQRGPLVVSISTSGSSPAYSKLLREQIENIIPDNIEQILDILGNLRNNLAERIPSQKTRGVIYREVMLALLESGNPKDVDVEGFVSCYEE